LTKGVIYVLISTMAFASMNVLVKSLDALHPMQVVFTRGIFAILLLVPYMMYNKISIWGHQKKLLALRGIAGTISIATFFIVLQRIPLGSSTSLRYLGPVFAALFAAYFLKEKINRWQWISFAIAFGGVIMIKGFDIRIDTLSFVLIITSAFFLGVTMVMIRYLNAREHFATIIFYFMLISALVSLLFVLDWRLPSAVGWLYLVGVGVLGLLGQYTFTIALKTEEASLIAPFRYLELVWALFFGYFLFSETYSWLPFVGIAMILLGMILNVYVKEKAS